jgi:hypothetical protein
MRSPVFVRNFEAVLRELAQRGHAVHVAFEGNKHGQPEQHSLIADLASSHQAITIGAAPVPSGIRAVLCSRLRGTADYLRYLEPEYADARALRARARRHALWGTGALSPVLGRSVLVRRTLSRRLSELVRIGPPPRRITRFLHEHDPDVLLVSPLTHFGSPQPDYLRAARRIGLKSALTLFSWDNLTNKGLMHEIPDRVIVWNEQQAREAVEHHGVPPDRIDVTGAAAYDHWFRWEPSRDRTSFLSALELEPSRPYVLYLCSSGFIARDEPAWIAEWLDALRATSGPLAKINVIVRPHPLNADGWRGDPLGARAGVRVFPPLGEDPKGHAARQSYFDSIYHAAFVVGINTTALVESAIVGRRSFTLRSANFAQTQDGTLHFHQLRERNGGPLRVADSMQEHLSQLAEGLEATAEEREHLQRFVGRFVRPHGLQIEVAPIVADRIEALAHPAQDDRASVEMPTGSSTSSR